MKNEIMKLHTMGLDAHLDEHVEDVTAVVGTRPREELLGAILAELHGSNLTRMGMAGLLAAAELRLAEIQKGATHG